MKADRRQGLSFATLDQGGKQGSESGFRSSLRVVCRKTGVGVEFSLWPFPIAKGQKAVAQKHESLKTGVIVEFSL